MDLRLPLQELVAHLPGARGAVLIDDQGEAVVVFSADGQEERLRLIAAYQRISLNQHRDLAAHRHLGEVTQMWQRYEFGTVLVRALPDDYALVVIGSSEMFFGAVHLYADKITPLITADF